MLATIRSTQLPAFDCRIKANPILETETFKVYELVDSSVPNGIQVKLNGHALEEARHVAIDVDGTAHVFDIGQRSLFGKLGPCELLSD